MMAVTGVQMGNSTAVGENYRKVVAIKLSIALRAFRHGVAELPQQGMLLRADQVKLKAVQETIVVADRSQHYQPGLFQRENYLLADLHGARQRSAESAFANIGSQAADETPAYQHPERGGESAALKSARRFG